MKPASSPSGICRPKVRLRLPVIPSPVPHPPEESEEGLDVFEDFLKKLKDDPGDEEEKPKPE